MKFIAATVSLLLAEQCSAQTARLRNNKVYKSNNAERKLQPGTVENIFDAAATPELISAEPTAIAVDALSIDLDLSIPAPEVLPAASVAPTTVAVEPTEPTFIEPTEPTAVEPTVAVLEGPDMGVDVVMSMSMPSVEAPILATIPAIATTVSDVIPVPESTLPSFEVDMSMPEAVLPTVVAVQTTGAPQTTVAAEFGGVEVEMSTPMVIPTVAQVATTGVAASSVAAVGSTLPAATTVAAVDTTPVATTSQSAAMTTEPAEIDIDLSMSISEIDTDFSMPGVDGSGGDSFTSMSTPSFIPPVEER